MKTGFKIDDHYGSPDERYSYKSALVERLRTTRQPLVCGRLTIELAEKLGFCWGVDRAVAMVWDAIRRNPGRRLWLLNQIIHNPKVNEDFRKSGVKFVFGHYAEPGGFDRVHREDLVRDGYVAERSGHNLGTAVDVTLVELASGRELKMGTAFDTFAPAARTDSASGEFAANRRRLRIAMEAEGFTSVPEEWWHYGYAVPDPMRFDLVIR